MEALVLLNESLHTTSSKLEAVVEKQVGSSKGILELLEKIDLGRRRLEGLKEMKQVHEKELRQLESSKALVVNQNKILKSKLNDLILMRRSVFLAMFSGLNQLTESERVMRKYSLLTVSSSSSTTPPLYMRAIKSTKSIAELQDEIDKEKFSITETRKFCQNDLINEEARLDLVLKDLENQQLLCDSCISTAKWKLENMENSGVIDLDGCNDLHDNRDGFSSTTSYHSNNNSTGISGREKSKNHSSSHNNNNKDCIDGFSSISSHRNNVGGQEKMKNHSNKNNSNSNNRNTNSNSSNINNKYNSFSNDNNGSNSINNFNSHGDSDFEDTLGTTTIVEDTHEIGFSREEDQGLQGQEHHGHQEESVEFSRYFPGTEPWYRVTKRKTQELTLVYKPSNNNNNNSNNNNNTNARGGSGFKSGSEILRQLRDKA